MEHKFKVGDKVKVHYLMGNRIGYIQERKSELRYDIRYDEGCIGHDIEENRIVKYNGNQDMEINVGDKVRVSKDAPKEFDRFKGDEMNYEVVRINPSKTIIQHKMAGLYGFTLAIPCKYLVKVDAEAKEPKFKVGDVVRIKPDADKLHQGYQNGYAWLPERDNYLGRVASVKEIWCDGSIILNIGSNLMWGPIDLEPYTEPEEESRNLSQETANCDKHFDNILKDSFRNERRLNIAAMAMQGILSNPLLLKIAIKTYQEEIGSPDLYVAVAKAAKEQADALIAECEQSEKLKEN